MALSGVRSGTGRGWIGSAHSRPVSAPATRTLGVRPAQRPQYHDVERGWAVHPSIKKEAKYSIPEGSRGRNKSPFRDTWFDQQCRASSHVPGPGAFRSDQEFLVPPLSARRRGSKARPSSAPVAGVGDRRGARCLAPERGADLIDARNIYLSRASMPKFSSVERTANLRNLRDAKNKSTFPTYYATPGPGAYTQFAEFGMPVQVLTPRQKAARFANDPLGAYVSLKSRGRR